MRTIHTISPKGTRSHLIKDASGNDVHNRHAATKFTKVLTKSDMEALFGVSTSELKYLGRKGLFRRLGGDRYLLDCFRTASLLNVGDKSLLSAKSRADKDSRDSTVTTYKHTSLPDEHAIDEFYQNQEKILEKTINIVNVPDFQYAELVAGRFLAEGLQHEERTAIVSFEHPDMLLSRLAEHGLSLNHALENEQLTYLYYKPDVTHSISLSNDYMELFREVERLGGDDIQRLVLLNVDSLINCSSEYLVNDSLHQLIYAANHFRIAVLGIFVATGHVGKLIDDGCRAILPSYFVID